MHVIKRIRKIMDPDLEQQTTLGAVEQNHHQQQHQGASGDESMIASDSTMQQQHQEAVSDSTSSKEALPYDDHKLFVGGLNWDTTESDLREYFASYGTVTEASLKLDPQTQRSRGYAFIVFQENDAVDKILAAKPHIIGGKEIDSKKAVPHAIHQAMKNRSKKVFVGGVPTTMSEETIREYFMKYGEIEEVALVDDKKTKERREFVFVVFMNQDSADSCCAEPHQNISGNEVEVKRAIPREQASRRPRGGGGGRGFGGPRGYGGSGSDWSAPYGGYAAYYPPPPAPMYQYDDYYHRDEPGHYGSRYGPKKSYGGGHYSHSGPSYHPYSRYS